MNLFFDYIIDNKKEELNNHLNSSLSNSAKLWRHTLHKTRWTIVLFSK